MAFHNPWNELLWSNQIFHFQNFGKTLTSLGGRLLPLSVAILLVFVEVEVIQIQNWLYLILQVQSDQHEPELLGSPRSFYRSCSPPLIPDQHSKGICSGHSDLIFVNFSPHENCTNFAYMATFSASHTCHMWRISDFSTSVMWRHLKFLHMWRNFQFPHNCHTWKAEISPHDNFFSTNIIRDIRDKYQVCTWISLSCYMDLSKLMHVFVKIDTWISLSFYMDLSKFMQGLL